MKAIFLILLCFISLFSFSQQPIFHQQNKSTAATPPTGAGTPWITVTSTAGGSLLANNTINLGMLFYVPTSVTITSLGRWVVSGNSASHLIQITAGSNSTNVFASATLNTAGKPSGAFGWIDLATPVTLTTGYYTLLSAEVNGGDQWYNEGALAYTLTGVAIEQGPVYEYPAGNVASVNSVGIGYIPLNFKYQ